MVQIQLELTDEQMAALEHLAAKRNISLDELLLEAIGSLLKSAHVGQAERRRRALAATGCFEGANDLARKHDEYLGEALET